MPSPKKKMKEDLNHNVLVKEEAKVAAGAVVDCRRSSGFTVQSMANTPYKQLQCLAKYCGIPCNLKKETLKMVINAKMNGQEEEASKLLKSVRESRLLRKIQKINKAKENSSAQSIIEEKNETREENIIKSASVESEMKTNKVKDLLRQMLDMKPPPNVTIQRTSHYARYRSFINPNNCNFGRSFMEQKYVESYQGNPKPYTIQHRPKPHTVTSQSYCSEEQEVRTSNTPEPSTSLAPIPVMPPSNGYTNHLCTDVSKRERLYTQGQPNPHYYMSTQRSMDHPRVPDCTLDTIRTQPHGQTSSSEMEATRYPYGIQRATPVYSSNNYMATHINSNFAGTQMNPYFVGTHINSNVNMAMSSVERNCSVHNRQTSNSFQCNEMLPMFGSAFPDKSVSETEALAPSYESIIARGLRNVDELEVTAMNKGFEGTPGQTNDNVLLKDKDNFSDEGNSSDNISLDVCNLSPPPSYIDTTSLLQNIPGLNNFSNLMPSHVPPIFFDQKAVILCKYGCHTPSTNLRLQIDHEQNCSRQPIQCPMTNCIYATQLSCISAHLLTAHNREIKSGETGAFYLDFTDGCSSFGQNYSLLKDCPYNLRFCQLVDGRLFIISVVGNVNTMQAVVYVQYINDYYPFRSHVAYEIVRNDGLPLQYSGEVLPITYSSVNIITRQKCLIFNLNPNNPAENLFVLHTKFVNY